MVALAIGEHNGTNTAMQIGYILVIRGTDRRECTNQTRPLCTVGQRNTWSNLRSCKGGIEVQGIGKELRISHILSFYPLHAKSGKQQYQRNFIVLFHHANFSIK